jgi:Icc-related predicted phosphoesterase
MKFIHLSDTHGKHHELPKLPTADLIIHSGDISMAGTGKEVMDFIDWFGALNYKYKIFIGGNHDFCMDGKARERIQRFLPENMYYLYNSGVEIANYGCPDLLQTVLKIKPKYHLFGHIHDAYGLDNSQATTFVNGSVMSEDYRLVNEARMFVI